MRKFFAVIALVCLPVTLIAVPGCGDSTKARKLEPADDVDFEALEKEESAMAAEMNDPANQEN